MTTTAPSRLLTDRRLFPVIGVVPYVVLAGLVAVAIVLRHGQPSLLVGDLVLCGIAAVWMVALFSVPVRWRTRPRIMAIFVAGIVVIYAAMVLREAWFGLFAVAGFLYAFGLLRWPWRLAGVGAVAAIAGVAQGSSLPRDTPLGLAAFVAIIAINIVVMCGYCWIQWTSDEVSVERARALAEISALQEQLVRQARQAGVQDERARMAREIHDTLAQGLIGIITQLEAADTAKPADRRSHLDAASALARESLSEARRSVAALRPEALDNARLSDALVDVAKSWSARTGTTVQVTTTGSPAAISSDAETALLRAEQEALANVAKHAHATRVGVTLSYLDGEVALDIRDDGAGLRGSATTADGGFGLVAMRERIEQLGGSVQLESDDGQGTTVSVRVPIEGGES